MGARAMHRCSARNGRRWGHGRRRHHRDDFRAVVEAAGLDPDEVTLYALRHSSIVRQLLANVPIRIVATLHDTSVKMIERTYSRHIAEHTDELARRALLEHGATASHWQRRDAGNRSLIVARCKGAPPRGDERISVDEALHRLLPTLNPHAAVELINIALRDNRARLFCDGVVVDPGFVRTHLVVEARLAADGRWSAGIEATRALDKPVRVIHLADGRQRDRWRLRPAPAEPSPRRKGSRAQDLIRRIAAENWPDGCEGVETGQIIKIVSPELEKRRHTSSGARHVSARARPPQGLAAGKGLTARLARIARALFALM